MDRTTQGQDEFGHRTTTVELDPPRPLTEDVESTSVIQGQAREKGLLAAGTLVRRVETNNLGAFAWLEVSTDCGRTWFSNERATSGAAVHRALGLESAR